MAWRFGLLGGAVTSTHEKRHPIKGAASVLQAVSRLREPKAVPRLTLCPTRYQRKPTNNRDSQRFERGPTGDFQSPYFDPGLEASKPQSAPAGASNAEG